jgi:rod shape-determining protein MreD
MSSGITRLTSVTARAGLMAWIGVPTLVSLLGLLIYVAPIRLLGFSVPMPLFPLMAIFFWAMARPKLMPPVVVFAIGLTQDLITGGPLGIWAFSYLCAYTLMTTQSDAFAGRGGGMLWAGFGIMVVATLLAAGLVGFVVMGKTVDFVQLLAQGAATFLVYPLAGRFYGRLQRTTQQARRMYDFHKGLGV